MNSSYFWWFIETQHRAQKSSHFQSSDGYGVGDDEYSISFDGCRKLTWHKAKSTPIDLPEWHSGSICGCFIDLDTKEIIFSLDGVERAVQAKDTFAAFADEKWESRWNFLNATISYCVQRGRHNVCNLILNAFRSYLIVVLHYIRLQASWVFNNAVLISELSLFVIRQKEILIFSTRWGSWNRRIR